MDAQVRKLFERYERLFRKSLAGDADMDEVTSVYASAFIAASPAGVMVGKNDDQLKQAMEQGYARYRAIGTKEMRIRDVGISPIDEHHCVAHVAWSRSLRAKAKPTSRSISTSTTSCRNWPESLKYSAGCQAPSRRFSESTASAEIGLASTIAADGRQAASPGDHGSLRSAVCLSLRDRKYNRRIFGRTAFSQSRHSAALFPVLYAV